MKRLIYYFSRSGFVRHRLVVLLCLLSNIQIISQIRTQVVRGVVKDKVSNQALIGVTVMLEGSDQLGTTTDLDGAFELENVPIGRQQFRFSYIGYQPVVTQGIIISGNRVEDILIFMTAGTVVGDIEIVADGNAIAPINELAVVSARSFSVEETERMPAGINDMGRMALSYPGVQQGGNDTENDIIIRGNSSMGILWRLEGMDIPNPNQLDFICQDKT